MYKSARVQLIIHSARHGTNLTLIELDNASIFSNYRLGKTHKNFGCKTGPNFEKVSCIV